MKEAGIQSYELKHVIGSSVSGTAAPPVAASSSRPERRWEDDMKQFVTFAQMKAYIQPRNHLKNWQVWAHWENLPKESDCSYQEAATSSHTLPKQSDYSSQEAATSSHNLPKQSHNSFQEPATSSLPELRWDCVTERWVALSEIKARVQGDDQVLNYWDTLPKLSDYSYQQAATSSLSEEVRWDWGMRMWVTFNEMKPCIQYRGFTDDQVLEYWDSLPKLFDCSDQEAPTSCKRAGSSGLQR